MYVSIGCGFVCLSLAALMACAAPADSDITASRKEFLALRRPLAYASMADTEDRNIPLYWLELHGQSRFFFTKWGTETLVYALWDFLDDSTYSADSTIMLLGGIGKQHVGTWQLSYKSPSEQGNWPAMAAELVRQCKRDSRSALGEPEWWRPHPVLFDRGRVLSESKTNAALRAAHIGAMVGALADPGIRAGNPLEVDNILGALSVLNAREAADTFVSYAFYNYKTGSDFRRVQAQTNNLYDVYETTIPITTYIPRLGNDVLPRVLNRFSSATLEEQEIGLGGGAAPALAVLYFVQLGATEAEAVRYIDSYIKHNEMSSEQVGALRKIREAVVSKKYRPEWLSRSGRPSTRTWAE